MNPLFKNFFSVPTSRRDVAEGELLVAEPFMVDRWFGRSVVLIIDHNAQGTTGLVMNNLVQAKIAEAVPAITRDDIDVYVGGPLGLDRLIYIHTLGDIIPGGHQVRPDLWVGGDFDAMIDYVNHGYPLEGTLRFIVGYSGWAPRQLAGELEKNSWAVSDYPFPASNLLEGTDDAYWHKIVEKLGATYRPWTVVPQDSRAN